MNYNALACNLHSITFIEGRSHGHVLAVRTQHRLRRPLISSLCLSGGNESLILRAFSGSLILSVMSCFGVLILNFVTRFFFDVKMMIFFVEVLRANFKNLRMSRICLGMVRCVSWPLRFDCDAEGNDDQRCPDTRRNERMVCTTPIIQTTKF